MKFVTSLHKSKAEYRSGGPALELLLLPGVLAPSEGRAGTVLSSWGSKSLRDGPLYWLLYKEGVTASTSQESKEQSAPPPTHPRLAISTQIERAVGVQVQYPHYPPAVGNSSILYILHFTLYSDSAYVYDSRDSCGPGRLPHAQASQAAGKPMYHLHPRRRPLKTPRS